MTLWLELVLLAFASFRLTRLVTTDDLPILQKARNRIVRARPGHFTRHYASRDTYREYEVAWPLGELILCNWCASAYTSGGLVLFAWLRYTMPMPIICWLAVWGAAALLAHWSSK